MYVETAANVVGYRRGKPKERWISDKTWQSIDERKSIKVKKDHLSFKDEDYSQLNAEYKATEKILIYIRKIHHRNLIICHWKLR